MNMEWSVRFHCRVLDSAGEIQASVTAPNRVTLEAVAGEIVWGPFTDDLEVPYLVRYHLVRGS